MKPKLFLDTKTFLLHAVYQKHFYYLKICTCNEATLEQRRWAKEQIVKRCPVLAQVSAVS